MEGIAHIRKKDGKIQHVETHLLEVKEFAERKGKKLNVSYLAGLAGMLHDLGKYSTAFTQYIQQTIANPDNPPRRGSVDHATAGGKLLFEKYHQPNKSNTIYDLYVAEIIGNVIISHHSYLHDYLTPELNSSFLKRITKEDLPEYEFSKKTFYQTVFSEEAFDEYVEKASKELETFLTKHKTESNEQKIMFLTKFLFSILLDADRTNSRLFEEDKEWKEIDVQPIFHTYYQRLTAHLQELEQNGKQTKINQLRKEMSAQCDEFASKPSGMYTLSIPTGGGKTLASLRYALRHVTEFRKERIIYILPYTTIIEQNAEELRNVLADDTHILEHHSNVIDYYSDDEEHDGFVNQKEKLKLAKENWDTPIVMTTMVQFLNTFYSKSSDIRRLHNLTNSVIIFDEVHKVPIHCITLFNQALNFLQGDGDSSIVLCTATQPALDYVEHKLGLADDHEMIANIEEVNQAFQRVNIVDDATNKEMTNIELADKIEEIMDTKVNCLIILNTKSVVKKLYQLLKEQLSDCVIYHLSTSMCAVHRKNILKEIKEKLNNKERVVCVSTQLIEAGVDISFQSVIRSLAGADSIAQAAGRCNRHGEVDKEDVYIIDLKDEKLDRLEEIKIGKEKAKNILLDMKKDPTIHGGSLLSQGAMTRYFHLYYKNFDKKLDYRIQKLRLTNGRSLNI
ncbi:CRISPR-associated endonuclease/helicase Cas3 [Gracilibacillus ureilyticus]|uniref:CRISPR-associated endonuclease/helicase Cas3 n=1 Tax=Gracilibacillus ureilyticus TaxID=531814 RepID=A0A1H9W0G1_9BACI|nr:CRISPR-associated endonuclease/helicase Cas3 [Gracilibacillus ureilyticus]